MKSYWEQYPAVKDLVIELTGSDSNSLPITYEGIRNAIKAEHPEVPVPSKSQIYRLKLDSGSVDAGRGKAGPGGRKNLHETSPEMKEYARELAENLVSRSEIRTKIAEKFNLDVSDWQVRTLLGYVKPRRKEPEIQLDWTENQQNPPVSTGRAQGPVPTGGKTPEPAITGNNGQQSAITGTQRPETDQIPPNPPASPFTKRGMTPEAVYTRPCTTPLVARPAPRGFPSGLRDKFATDLVEIPELSAKALAMLSHDQAEGCKLPGVIRQSLISCLKRQVTAGHPRYIKPLGGGGLALNLFYLRCSQCPNFLSDQDCDAVIEGLREIWRKRASERNRRVA